MEIGCLLAFLAFVGFLILAYGPGFVTYRREQSFHRRVHQVAESIRTALAAYADHHPEGRFPENVGDYQALRDLVNKHGGLLPESSVDADIAQISYTSDDGSDYELTITLDVPDNVRKGKFLRVTPEEVTRHREIPK
jgi:type II secretory pathway pseudopilin PulG